MNVLLIGEYIAPAQYVAAIRWTKIAKYLKKNHDVIITVLTDQKNWEHRKESILHNSPQVDEMLLKDMDSFAQYYEVPCGKMTAMYLTLRKWVRGNADSHIGMSVSQARLSNDLLSTIKRDIKHFVFDIRSYLHAKDVWLFYKNNLKKKYDVIISSFSPAWSHQVGNRIKREESNLIWFADFRDPYVTSFDGPFARWRHKRFMMRYCATADKVLRVSDIMKTDTPSYVPVYTISNGYDPKEVPSPLPPAHFDIVYTGSLYGERSDIGMVCEMLKELCSENRILAEDVTVVYVGEDETVAKTMAKKHHAEEFLKTTGLLPRVEARKMQQKAAMLLHIDWNTKYERCFWSGKMYEYMAAQKPILYLVSGDLEHSKPSEEIHYLGGCCYEEIRHEETYPMMKKYILEKYDEWKQTGNVTVLQDREYIEKYSYEVIAEQVWQLIQEGNCGIC